MASGRVRQFRRRRSRPTSISTVRVLRPRRSAISLLVKPRASQRKLRPQQTRELESPRFDILTSPQVFPRIAHDSIYQQARLHGNASVNALLRKPAFTKEPGLAGA